jgi:6-phosphofructokinase 1
MAKMNPDDLEYLETVPKDEHGHPRLAEINSAAIIKQHVRDTLSEMGIKMTIVDKEVGYELRCADPSAFDIDYTRTLGQAAVDFLTGGGTNAMISVQGTEVVPIPYDDLIDPKTNRAGVRLVNTDSLAFRSASRFMVRLDAQDLSDPAHVQKLAACTNLSPEEFVEHFGYLTGVAPRPF